LRIYYTYVNAVIYITERQGKTNGLFHKRRHGKASGG